MSKDDGSVTSLTDTSATELSSTNAPGWYTCDLTQAETNGDKLLFTGKSSTSNVAVVGALLYTTPANFTAASINSSGHVTLADSSLTTAKLGTFALAKTTNITGFNDIAATDVVSGGAITTSSGTVSSVTTAGSVTGAVGSVTGNVGGNVTGSVGSVATGGITAASFAANAITAAKLDPDVTTELQSGLATASALATVAGYLDTEVAAILQDTGTDIPATLATIVGYLDTEVAAIKAKTDNLPSDPADASDIATAFSGVNTKLDTIDDFLDTEVAAIKAKTDLIPASPAATGDIPSAATIAAAVRDVDNTTPAASSLGAAVNASASGGLDPQDVADLVIAGLGTVDANVVSMAANTLTASALASDAVTEIQAGLATAAALTTVDDFLDTEIAAIKAKTDNLPADPAGLSALATAHGAGSWATATGFSTLDAAGVRTAIGLTSANLDTQLAAIAGYIDTEVASTLAAVDTEVSAIKAKTDQLTFTTANRVDASAGNVTLADGAITDAKFTMPAEAAGQPTTALATIRRIGERLGNKVVRDRDDGTVLLRNAADSGNLETRTQSTDGTVDTQSKAV